MDDAIRQVVAILKGIWLKRWIGLIVAWVVGIGGVFVVLSMPNKYEATARIFVDTQSVLKPLMAGLAVQPNVDQQIVMLSKTLMSRPNMEKLIRMADLDLKLKSKEEKEKLIDDLLSQLKLEVISQNAAQTNNLYIITYRDASPDKAKRLVQSLMTIFVESGTGDKRKDTDTARKFIEEQISAYQKKLEEAENRLKEFKLRNMALAGAGGKDYFVKAGEVNAQLEQARLELMEAKNSREAMKRELLGEEPVVTVGGEQDAASQQVSLPEFDARIDLLKKNLDILLQKYTDQHPDVVGTRKVIAQLEEQKKQELIARAKAAGGKVRGQSTNPVYQQLKVNIAELEANIASLEIRVKEYEARAEQVKASANLQPELEQEFVQLNRDYEIMKLNYNQLVGRRESANMAEQMEATSGVADFRIIDPPRVSPKPVAPNRLLLLPIAFLAALGAGVAVSFLMAQIRPTFMDAKSLRDISGLPVLGSITVLKSEAQLRQERRRLMYFFSGIGGLVALFGVAMVVLFVTSLKV